jgi:hypothetical protein
MPTEHDGSGSGWSHWLRHVGVGDLFSEEGLRFNQALLALEAAANGLGVALVRRRLIGDDLASGRLVRLLPHEAPTSFSYFFVCLPEAIDRPAVGAFCKWLLAEAASWSAAHRADPAPREFGRAEQDHGTSRRRAPALAFNGTTLIPRLLPQAGEGCAAQRFPGPSPACGRG